MNSPKSWTSDALKIAVTYLFFGVTWIFLSDRLLAIIASDATTLNQLQTYKGWFFIIVTTALLFFLVHGKLKATFTAENRAKKEEIAREAAESADRMKSVFLATMSHELRTPLNTIIGFTGVLQQGLAGPLNEEQLKQTGMVRESARHLLNLINDILDLSKIEAGQLEIAHEHFDVAASITGITQGFEPMLANKPTGFEVHIEDGLASFTGDRRRFEQILLNLLSNAVKFTAHGTIRLDARKKNNELVVSVSDTGIGIPKDQVSKVFVPFEQIDTGLDRRREGTGLGLSISRQLARLMNGDLKAMSAGEGGGSVFTLTLPYETTGARRSIDEGSIA